jgi:tRNA 2-thiouridine synthesizing protein A
VEAPFVDPELAIEPSDVWDAGDMGCGELIVLLRARIRELAPGQVLRVVARDPGAPEDLPAWSRLTGHRLVRAEHPVYEFARKPIPPETR